MEVLGKNNVRLSPSLITILATSLTLGLCLSVKAEYSGSKVDIANNESKDQVLSLKKTEEPAKIPTKSEIIASPLTDLRPVIGDTNNLENFRVIAQVPCQNQNHHPLNYHQQGNRRTQLLSYPNLPLQNQNSRVLATLLNPITNLVS